MEKVLEIEFVKVWDNWAWRIVKNGYAIDGTQEEEEVIKYFCGCDEHIRYRRIEELKKVADWEEEDERD